MGILYLAALIVGLGTIALQLFGAGDHAATADVDVGGDVDVDADADADADAHAGVVHEPAVQGDHGIAPIFLSIRFWTFALMAFGLSGTLMHYLDLAHSAIVLGVAVALGLVSGFGASLTFRALAQAEANSGADSDEAVGQVGKVLVPLGKNARGKVRVEIKGQSVDLIATTDDDRIDAGQLVLVEEMRESTAHVSPAPPELVPPKREPP